MNIIVQDLSFGYGKALILEDVSFAIPSGEFIGVFGPNGGGKTTLLKLLLGLLEPRRGSISIKGLAPHKALQGIGYVPQSMHSDPHFPISTLDVVLMGCLRTLKWTGNFSTHTRDAAHNALERVGLAHKAGAPFGALSGGEAQRALIARAIASRPQLLLLDEPTANVDVEAQKGIYALLAELNREMTILMVSHDLHTIVHRVSRLLYVHRGVSFIEKREVCEHFALGLYHAPLLEGGHGHFSL